MSKGKSGKGKVGQPGPGPRPQTGFQGGNWPSTTGNVSGKNRGNAPAKVGK